LVEAAVVRKLDADPEIWFSVPERQPPAAFRPPEPGGPAPVATAPREAPGAVRAAGQAGAAAR